MQNSSTSTELALTEDASLRAKYADRVDVLERVSPVRTIGASDYTTTSLVSAYFAVDREVIRQLVHRHRAELEENDYRVLYGQERQEFLNSVNGAQFTERRGRWLAVFTRRTVLNVAMLLRDSQKAKEIRTALLNMAEGYVQPAAQVVTVDEAALGSAIGAALGRVLAPVYNNLAQAITDRDETLLGISETLLEINETMKGIRTYQEHRPEDDYAALESMKLDPLPEEIASILKAPLVKDGQPFRTGPIGADGRPWAAYGEGRNRIWYQPRSAVINAYRLYWSDRI